MKVDNLLSPQPNEPPFPSPPSSTSFTSLPRPAVTSIPGPYGVPTTNIGMANPPLADRFVSVSSDIIVSKLAQMQAQLDHTDLHHAIQNGRIVNNIVGAYKGNDNKRCLYLQFRDCEYRVNQFLKHLDLQTAFGLVEICHFYLNDVYFPYDIHLMKLKIRKFYRPVICFEKFLEDDDTLFKPLLLMTFALGKRYKGEVKSDSIIDDLLHYSLWFVNPIINIKKHPLNYLIVAVYTITSLYFRSRSMDDDAVLYSNFGLQFATHLKLHEAEPGPTDNKEMQLKSRIIWTCYGINRTTSAKMGDPHLLSFDDITRDYPTLQSYDDDGKLISTASSEDDYNSQSSEFKYYVELTHVAEDIYNVVYSNYTPYTLTTMLGGIIQKLIQWNASLPQSFRLENNINETNLKRKRLVCSLHLNYCFSIHLTTIPVIYNLVEKQKRAVEPVEINEKIYELVIICMNAAQMTVSILDSCLNDGMLAVFGVMDLDYIYSAALTFFMCGDVLKILTPDCNRLLDSCMFMLNEMSKGGNSTATIKYKNMQELISNSRKQAVSSKIRR
ncbi:unnamed protein product [Ambrosiozyma monospora]|uniref:Unnamed protein product n=1 Tax=Ambrosiozyma monospora TaxID=43982 RepID=A0ACB5T713_AMBMO|nr:unnamed protein product [Ambrosiozyma monospora]